jgi:hypothetical protein
MSGAKTLEYLFVVGLPFLNVSPALLHPRFARHAWVGSTFSPLWQTC